MENEGEANSTTIANWFLQMRLLSGAKCADDVL